ncbi:MAG: DnaB-like helicase N-terminal domain-containing protein [Lawsonibacter sp.]
MVAQKEDRLSAQVAVLGSLLIDDRLVGQALERIRPEDFLAPKCRMVFQAIRALFAEGKPTDAVTVRSKLGGREGDGWTQYLMELMELTPRRPTSGSTPPSCGRRPGKPGGMNWPGCSWRPRTTSRNRST